MLTSEIRKTVSLRCSFLVLDEGDRMLDEGFEDEVAMIGEKALRVQGGEYRVSGPGLLPELLRCYRDGQRQGLSFSDVPACRLKASTPCTQKLLRVSPNQKPRRGEARQAGHSGLGMRLGK